MEGENGGGTWLAEGVYDGIGEERHFDEFSACIRRISWLIKASVLIVMT